MTQLGTSRDDLRGSADGVARLFAGLRGGPSSGQTRALARAVSLVEDGAAEAGELLRLCREVLAEGPRAIRIGITGPAGAGKSTLVDALTRELRNAGRRVGIVAVDPSSPFSGGAILGDRIRLTDLAGDPDVYMRSMATRGHLGGLAAATEDVLTVIEASGKDVLLIETTGVGQGEIEVVGLADVVAVVLVPGMGDSIQSLKAGVLEIASVFVLNKADAAGIERLESEIGEMVGLSHALAVEKKIPPVVKTVATTGVGVGELLGVVDSLAAEQHTAGAKAPRQRDFLMPGMNPRPTLQAKAMQADHLAEAKAVSVEAMAESIDDIGLIRAGFGGAVLDHLGIAVRSLTASAGLYQALGVEVSGVEEVAQERVRVAMLAVGQSRIELLEATSEDSTIARFVAKRGEGLHHIALRVPDLALAVERMKERGLRLVSDRIQVGAGGHRYVFVHPASANGVLVELVEAAH
jgi:LAO/AO transport system kinase